MAAKATIFKALLQIADMDRQYYADHALTLARHPSETDERMMVRLLAFARHAHPELAFGAGLSTDEPDLWMKDPAGIITLWIDVGQPDEKRLRKACNRATRVWTYSYGGRAADTWWDQNHPQLERLDNLGIVNVPYDASHALAGLAQRSMQLQCTIQEGLVWIGNGSQSVQVDLEVRKPGR